MMSIRETCLEFFKNEDIKRDVKEVIRPIFTMMYNEIYVYIWLICIYHVFFIFIVLANFYFLLKLRTSITYCYHKDIN
jgi:hypothetical protein